MAIANQKYLIQPETFNNWINLKIDKYKSFRNNFCFNVYIVLMNIGLIVDGNWEWQVGGEKNVLLLPSSVAQ